MWLSVCLSVFGLQLCCKHNPVGVPLRDLEQDQWKTRTCLNRCELYRVSAVSLYLSVFSVVIWCTLVEFRF